MTNSARKMVVLVLVGIVVVVSLGIGVVRRMTDMQVRTISGTIMSIDVQARTASIEFVHPKTGRTLQIDGTVPPGCDISIDGRPASMEDLRVGEQAEVEGTIHRDMTISVNWVRVSRTRNSSSTQPTSTPADQDP